MSSDDGVKNPSGFLMNAFTPVYLATVPLTIYLAKEGGIVQKVVEGIVSLLPGSAGIAKDRTIPALSALYIFVTFAATGAASVSGQAAARPQGLDNDHPRAHVNSLTGLPLRLRSAHYNLLENFPGFALAAALAQSTAPGNQVLINLLGLHVILKSFVFYPSYLAGIAPVRSLAHLGATGAVIAAAWQVAKGAR